MTVLREHPTDEITRMPVRSRAFEWTAGILGVLAAAVGAWMYFVPSDWFLGGLAEGWYLGAFIGAGVLLAFAFGVAANRAFALDHGWTGETVTWTVLSLLALAAAVVFTVIWIV